MNMKFQEEYDEDDSLNAIEFMEMMQKIIEDTPATERNDLVIRFDRHVWVMIDMERE